jgi:hypothetical protein
MSEVTVNNELKLGICSKKRHNIFFYSWLDPTIIYRYHGQIKKNKKREQDK